MRSRSHHLIVVGGGFIGCEVAASAKSTGASVALIEKLDAPLIGVLGPVAARLVTDILVHRGVDVHTDSSVVDVMGGESIAGVRLDNGTVLHGSDVLLGLGVSPDLDRLASSRIDVDDGIVCNTIGRTSANRVWALGDVAAWHHPLAGRGVRIEHWTSAVDQAAVVAQDIATGHAASLDTVPYFWSDIFDTKVQALGFVNAGDDTHIATPGGRTVVLYSQDDRLTAVVGFSAAKHIMRLRAHVAAGTHVDEVLALLA